MKFGITASFAALLLCAWFSCASWPAEVRADENLARDPSTKPDSDFPSPAELMKKMKEEQAKKAKLSRVVYFDLTEPMEERPATSAFLATID